MLWQWRTTPVRQGRANVRVVAVFNKYMYLINNCIYTIHFCGLSCLPVPLGEKGYVGELGECARCQARRQCSPMWGLAGSVARMYLGVSSSSSRWVTSPVQLCKRMGWVSVSIPSKRLAILSFLCKTPKKAEWAVKINSKGKLIVWPNSSTFSIYVQ